jgi:hypothetical protein
MKIYNTASLPSHISADETLWLYNGLDSLLTHEIWQKLAPDLGPTYRFERLQLGPVMSLMRRGFAVDTAARDAAINGPGGLIARAYRLGGMTKIDKGGKGTWKVTDESALLQRLAKIVWGKPLNYHSGTQLKAFFYGAGGLRIPEIRESKKGETKVIVNRNALEKITAHYVRGMFIAAIILRLRDIEKQIEVLTKGLSPDGRFIPSYNIGGTDTWRWCLPGDTEVLTPNGWMPFEEWRDQPIAVWDIDQSIRFELAKKVSFKNDRPLIEIVNSRFHLRCTDEHRIPFYSSKRRFDVALASERRQLHAVPLTGFLKRRFEPDVLTRICVMVQADGCVVHDGLIRFHFRKQRKIDRCRQLLTDAGITFRSTIGVEGTTYIYVCDPPKWMRQAKHFGSWLLEHNPTTVIDELVHWDGCRSRHRDKSFTYVTTVKENADWVKTVSHLAGLFASIRGGEKRANANWKPAYRVFVGGDRTTRIQKAHYTNGGAADVVYCAETSTGFFLVRSNGQISVTGNSSSKHPYRHSSNGQNIDPALRHIFIADPGRVFVAVDLKGAESVVVAYLSGDENYIRAVNSADVHVAVCKLIWPDMGWTGDIAADRALADREFWNGKSYRDISKMCGHASSYMSTPFTIARQGNISMAVAEEFQRKYFRAFPGIRKWQQWVAGQIQQTSQLTNIFGMTRTFWDREWDDATVRKAVAFGPQSAVGTLLNIGQYMIWHRHEPAIQLHAQIHDAVVCSVDEKSVEQGLHSILDCIEMPVEVTDINGVTRTMLIKGDAKVGLNWGDRIEKDDGVIINPNGLKKWKAPTTPTPMPLAA